MHWKDYLQKPRWDGSRRSADGIRLDIFPANGEFTGKFVFQALVSSAVPTLLRCGNSLHFAQKAYLPGSHEPNETHQGTKSQPMILRNGMQISKTINYSERLDFDRARCSIVRQRKDRQFRTQLPRIALLAALICFPLKTQAADPWTKLPTVEYDLNNKQDAIAFVDERHGWYGNGTGRVYRTSDGGASWQNVWRRKGVYVRALEFVDQQTGFLGNIGPNYFPNVTDVQPLYVTHDSGKSWSPVKLAAGRQITGVCAIDVLKIAGKEVVVRAGGRVGGPASMIESFDGGRTFRSRDMSSLTSMILDIHFVDENVGFIAGASASEEAKAHARILKTTDAGKTWRAVFDSDRLGDNNWKLAFPTPRVGYATIISYEAPDSEARGYIVKTEDGGEHWQKQIVTSDKTWVPFGINFLNEQRGWVGGSSGGYETIDGGLSWHPVEMGLSTNKISISKRADGSATAFAIGKDVYKLDIPSN